MAFPADITLGTQTYSSSVVKPGSVVRSDATKPVTSPALVTISHETNKTGQENSVFISDRFHSTETYGSQKTRALLKIQYNPTLGHAEQEAELAAVIADIVEFFGISVNVDKFINKEV